MSIEKVVAALNAAFAADPCAIHALIVNRVPCNQALADDPFVQVDCPPVLREGLFQVGAIGLINGVLAAIGLPLAATMFSDEKDDDGRSKLLGFTVYKPSQPEVIEIQSAQPEPDQYWQHKTSGDRAYFVGRTPDGEMVFQCEGDGVETGNLDWSGCEHLPGCDSWAWKPKPVSSACNSQPSEYWSTRDSSRFAYVRVDANDQASLINHDGTVGQVFPWNSAEKYGRLQITKEQAEELEIHKPKPVVCPPVFPDRIPLRLWVKREVIGMHMAAPIVARRDFAGDDMAEVFSDGNGGLFIERSRNAGN